MTALTDRRANSMERWTHRPFILASGFKGWTNGKAALRIGTGKVEPLSDDPDHLYIGIFDEDYDATAGDTECSVNLGLEIEMWWWANDEAGEIEATDVGRLCYALDDQTVTIDGAGRPIAGRIWAVDPVDGVLVEKLQAPDLGGGGGGGGRLGAEIPDYVSNTSTLTEVEHGSTYDVKTTAAASVIVLPAGEEGQLIWFSADGTKNGHTVTYRDGATPITGALPASKRHLVAFLYLDGTWRANAYSSP